MKIANIITVLSTLFLMQIVAWSVSAQNTSADDILFPELELEIQPASEDIPTGDDVGIGNTDKVDAEAFMQEIDALGEKVDAIIDTPQAQDVDIFDEIAPEPKNETAPENNPFMDETSIVDTLLETTVDDNAIIPTEEMSRQPAAAIEEGVDTTLRATNEDVPSEEPVISEALAQQNDTPPAKESAAVEEGYAETEAIQVDAVAPSQESQDEKNLGAEQGFVAPPSLFFTFWQHKAIEDAKNAQGFVRPPTQAELDALENGEMIEEAPPQPGDRDLALGGIVYKSSKNWTIWLNSVRITPDAIPSEVMDLRVFKDYIEVKWLDDYTNQVFPIRLRPHQRFNMDRRIFLPG